MYLHNYHGDSYKPYQEPKHIPRNETFLATLLH